MKRYLFRLITLATALGMTLSLTACGGSDDDDSSAGDDDDSAAVAALLDCMDCHADEGMLMATVDPPQEVSHSEGPG